MHAAGVSKINDVIQYIFFTDGLYKYVKDAPTPRSGRMKKEGEPEHSASEYLELLLVSTQRNDKGDKIEILLDGQVTL